MTIRTERDNGVFTIRIARPEKKNAFTTAMYLDFAAALEEGDKAAGIHAILILGEPDIFAAGNDIEDFLAHPFENRDAPVFRFMRALVACERPVVAGVEGMAVGIGATMLLHCDLVYLASRAKLSMPFTALALVPEFASSLILPRLMGHARASGHLLLGAPITAEEALASGIASAVLPAEDVRAHARDAALHLGTFDEGAIRTSKALMRKADRAAVLSAIDAEADVYVERLKGTATRAAFQAFLDRGKARR